MTGIITQLVHLILASRYQVVKTRDYIRENKEWPTARDWKRVRLKLGFIIRTLLELRYRLKPSYPEGDIVRADEVFWLNNNHGAPVTEMYHHIDRMTIKIIEECKTQGNLVDIDNNDVDYFKQYARKHQFLANKGKMVICPACEDANSSGCHWRIASNVQAVCISKRPGSAKAKANKVEKCQPRDNMETFRVHLENKKECIYHRLTQGVEEMEQ